MIIKKLNIVEMNDLIIDFLKLIVKIKNFHFKNKKSIFFSIFNLFCVLRKESSWSVKMKIKNPIFEW